MDEARASWNTIYQSKEGFECQITLRDEDETSLAERIKKVVASLTKSGGAPVKRRNNHSGNGNNSNNGGTPREDAKSEKPEKTYMDERGVRRCNLKLKNGKTCGQPVTEREGRYGPFWSCPDFKEHG